jgi:2-dehydropantoate 2-reductase
VSTVDEGFPGADPDRVSPPVVAVLGPGGVGGALAVKLARAGCRVVCVGRPDTVAAIRRSGLRLETPEGAAEARPEAVERLDHPVSLLIVAVKATSLPEALERVELFAVADGVVLTLLNGLEHPDVVRRELGNRVAPGSISRFEGYRSGPAAIVQTTRRPRITAASDDLTAEEVEHALSPLRAADVDVVVLADERAVLWEKAARMAPLAAATVASGLTVGALRADPAWVERVRAGVVEACEVAAADGVAISPASELGIIEAMPETLTSSTARDVAAGRPSELDAVVGSVVRAGERLGVPVPVLRALLEDAEAACRGR